MLSFVKLNGVVSPNSCAPGVVYEDGRFHMLLQTEFERVGGYILYLVSKGGDEFDLVNIALNPIPGTLEAGIYDPHPVGTAGGKYFTYSAFPEGKHVQGDIHLARSVSGRWDGPWERLGAIVRHEDVPFHNPRDHHDYEWGLEGSHVTSLTDGRFFLSCVCFLPEGRRGTRQRVFFATSDRLTGPYRVLTQTLEPGDHWESGETGHATSVVTGEGVKVFYQAISKDENRLWRYGVATINPAGFAS